MQMWGGGRRPPIRGRCWRNYGQHCARSGLQVWPPGRASIEVAWTAAQNVCVQYKHKRAAEHVYICLDPTAETDV
jgi:hypothetical protein